MTNHNERTGVSDAQVPDPGDTPRQEGVQLAGDDDRAELRRALLVYGTAGALGPEHARSARNDLRG